MLHAGSTIHLFIRMLPCVLKNNSERKNGLSDAFCFFSSGCKLQTTALSQSHVLHKPPTRPVHYSGGECVAFSRLSPSQGDEHLGTRAAGSHASGGSGSPASHATVSFPLGPTDLSTGARTNRSVSLSPQPMRMRGGGPMRCRQWKKQCNILSEGDTRRQGGGPGGLTFSPCRRLFSK